MPAIAFRPPERQALVQALQYANALSTDTALPHDYWLVEVDPDFSYRDFFAQLNVRGSAATLIQQAHAEIADSPYILFTRTFSLE